MKQLRLWNYWNLYKVITYSLLKILHSYFYQRHTPNAKKSDISLRKTSPYSESFWSAFFPDFPAFGLNTKRYSSPNAGKSGKNADQNNSEYGLFYAVSVTESFFKQNSKCFWITSLLCCIFVVSVCYILRRLLFKLKFCSCNGHVGFVCAETCTIYNQSLFFLVNVLKFIYKRKWRETRLR